MEEEALSTGIGDVLSHGGMEGDAEQSSSTVRPWTSHGHQLFCGQGDSASQESEWAHFPEEPSPLGPLAGLSHKHPGAQEPGPTLVTKASGTCSPQDPTSPPALCSLHSGYPREGPASPLSHSDSPETCPLPHQRPRCCTGGWHRDKAREAPSHPLLFEWQHYSFTLAHPPCLLFLTCQILSIFQEKSLPFTLSSHSHSAPSPASGLIPLSQTCFSRFPGHPRLRAPHPTHSPCPLPSKVQPKPCARAHKPPGTPSDGYIIQTRLGPVCEASLPACPREDPARGSLGRLSVPDMPCPLQLPGLCFFTAPCSNAGASEAPS